MAQVKVGDTVTVPGDMHGTVKFVGSVAGKRGTFAGVQLASEYAARGKNSGDVEGKHYFRTSIPGSGIFLPVEKATKKGPAGYGARASPAPGIGTPTRLSSFSQSGRTPLGSRPNFSQSVGPAAMRAGAASPALKPPIRRESLPRPASPLRKVNTPAGKTQLTTPKTRPSTGFSRSTMAGPSAHRSPGKGTKFSQSLRQPTIRPDESPSLGPEPAFDDVPEEEAESTPTPTPAVNRQTSVDESKHQEDMQQMQRMMDLKEQALKDQAGSIAEMERSLTELQKLVPGLSDTSSQRTTSFQMAEEEDLPKDVVSLRSALREKNEKIKVLTAEFDNNRADFRSTIDTLEMASTETERVYEKRVDELLEEVRNLQDRSEDVESVAQQFKQLEELVQELEEGLEDARRGEAEARGEVEFLRGEVERSKSELRRERERGRTEEQLNGYGGPDSERLEELQSELDGKDDEIRGLKAIIHNLNTSADAATPKANGVRHQQRNESTSDGHLQRQIQELESLLQQKSAHEEELETEVTKLRSSMHLGRFPMPGSNQQFGLRSGGNSRPTSSDAPAAQANKHTSSGTVNSQRTVVLSPDTERREWHTPPHEKPQSPLKHSFDHDDTTADNRSEASVSSASLWCEICEESGHDILTCANMMVSGSSGNKSSQQSSPAKHNRNELSVSRPAPLVSRKSTNSLTSRNSNPGLPPDEAMPPPPIPAKSQDPVKSPLANGFGGAYSALGTSSPSADEATKQLKAPVEGTGDQAGMWAGKSTGVIDPDKWCALCERDGHESVDCPIEDAF